MKDDDIKIPPFETHDLRINLKKFLDSDFHGVKIGNYTYGVYAFFDYDNEPIYVGQTNEKLRTRIRRHLTNQRTDAVAMSVLDPFEVFRIEVWPLSQYEGVSKKSDPDNYKEACSALNALEFQVFEDAIANSKFKAILNEKDPPEPVGRIVVPASFSSQIVSDEVHAIRKHPDFRIARRASILAKLAQVISERHVSSGLRKTLLTQSKRLQWLAERRFENAVGSEEED
jgi:GIY-YIG catalytic domain